MSALLQIGGPNPNPAIFFNHPRSMFFCNKVGNQTAILLNDPHQFSALECSGTKSILHSFGCHSGFQYDAIGIDPDSDCIIIEIMSDFSGNQMHHKYPPCRIVEGTHLRWIAPCRKQFERITDYQEAA
ncbi:hypothetical protein UFOVP152_53 [uncultured Caudovirales phage]|uniref:Uncharacterized protein n=1 Tax=uncultured Caudovirales phage TaxID=2100421 RepID=A0A6J7WDU2_9CAUD|nr:hypothetical protein UFOVP152_53 [uncultured Caudovirales phage]